MIDVDVADPVETTAAGERILTAATELFRARGIADTGVDAIVDRAGTTKRTLYQRFGSKEVLVARYLQQRAHLWQRELRQALAAASVEEFLDVVYELTARWATQEPAGCAFANAWSQLGDRDHAAAAVIRAEKRWMTTLFTRIASGDASVGQLLHLIHEGAQVSASINGDPEVFAQACAASKESLARR